MTVETVCPKHGPHKPGTCPQCDELAEARSVVATTYIPPAAAFTSNQETNRDKALRGEVVKLTADRLQEMQRQAIAHEGVAPLRTLHWHWVAMINELIALRALSAAPAQPDKPKYLYYAAQPEGAAERRAPEILELQSLGGKSLKFEFDGNDGDLIVTIDGGELDFIVPNDDVPALRLWLDPCPQQSETPAQLGPDEAIFWACVDKECGRYNRQPQTHCIVCGKQRDPTHMARDRVAETKDQWQPIATAPKERCTVVRLAWNPHDWTIGDGFYFDGQWLATGFFHSESRASAIHGPAHQIRELVCDPVFWMPLPSAPQRAKAVETAEVQARNATANVALTCDGACRYDGPGVFHRDPTCSTHGSPEKATGEG